MTSHRIEVEAFAIVVIGDRHPALDKLTESFGSYRSKQRRYEFPRSTEQRVRDALAATPAATPIPAASTLKTGWSNAARRRAGQTSSHPLGEVAHRGDGYTEYHDGIRGTGTVQIWDES